jgi:hypothetical protein
MKISEIITESIKISEFEGDATQFSNPTQTTPTTERPPRRGYSIELVGRPGKDWMAQYAWEALEKVLPRDYPGNSQAAAAGNSNLPPTNAIRKVLEVGRHGSAVIKTGIASEDIAETIVSKLSANRLPAKFLRITSEDLDESEKSPMFKDSQKADRVRSLKNLIAIAKEQGRQLRVQELELELKKVQGRLNEFAPDSNDDGNGEEDALLKYAKMWYQGDLKTQQQVEKILDRMGWEIGELESEEGGCFVMRSDDENSYIGFSAEDLQ